MSLTKTRYLLGRGMVATFFFQLITLFGHYYKQKSTFYIHSINDIYKFYYTLHTSFNK